MVVQDSFTGKIVEVNKGCEIPGFQPVQGSICLRLLLMAGINFNIGVKTGQDDKDKNKILKEDQSQQSKEQKRDENKKKKGQKKKKKKKKKEQNNADDEE
ncbi:cyclic nucleotide-gated channel cone photoreceptor subunit alpha-like [Podarcis raffonei]|uniref:cyclic nucleotide-gated channel cone photoreceptor subunit alpha-like n=1 Tax=Podarcis raffonei TaxID=65483 RepID=UPI0023299440|nr:cyclic nucleotide-gated channel cone photoreceptor subunit alpha-like [Podarcis raffonei]